MQAPPAKPPVGFLFDTAMSGISDALALAMLHGLDAKGETRLLSVTVSRPSLKAAQFCDAFTRFYGAFRATPVGLVPGNASADPPMIAAVLDQNGPDGAPVYPRQIKKFTDTALVPAVSRNVLTGQYDGNAIVVLDGPATDLAKWLSMPGAKEAIAAKVRLLAIASTQAALHSDAAAAQTVLSEWPSPVITVGEEVGAALHYPAGSIEKDFTFAPNHPLVDAWKAEKNGAELPLSAMAAILYAARPEAGLFKVSAADSHGRRHLSVDPAQQEKVVAALVELASAKPNRNRPRRFGQ
jgi:hypothetical protein